MEKQQMSETAERIYSAVFGLDDKAFRAEKVQEIYDWLADGDLQDSPDLDTLTAEWVEYDVTDVRTNGQPMAWIAYSPTTYAAAVNLMDDDIRERLHNELAPCTNIEFLQAYAAAHREQFGETWELAKDNPVW